MKAMQRAPNIYGTASKFNIVQNNERSEPETTSHNENLESLAEDTEAVAAVFEAVEENISDFSVEMLSEEQQTDMIEIGVPDSLIHDLWMVWCVIDVDHNNTLTCEELSTALEAFGHHIDKYEVEDMLREASGIPFLSKSDRSPNHSRWIRAICCYLSHCCTVIRMEMALLVTIMHSATLPQLSS